MKTIEEFYSKVKEDQELQKAVAAAIEAGTAEAYLKEQGVSGTLQELNAYIKAQDRGGKIELSDDEMAAASGGRLSWSSHKVYKTEAEVDYVYNMFDRVEVWLHGFAGPLCCTQRGTVYKKYAVYDSYFGGWEPMYDVMFDSDGKLHDEPETMLSY